MILCLTHSSDHYTIDLVRKRLETLGHELYRFDSDRFGTDYLLSYELDGGHTRLRLTGPPGSIAATDISAVWYRKLWSLQRPERLSPNYAGTYQRAYTTYRDIFLNHLAHLPWINDRHHDHAVCGDKLRQLEEARACGLRTPPTLMTNDLHRLRAFHDECGGDVIMKLHNPLSQHMQGGAFLPTTALRKEQLPDSDALRLCPMIFQQRVAKAYELRIVYVDGAFFTGRIEAANAVDWRSADLKEQGSVWQPYALPQEIKHSIETFMRTVRLSFGAIDMIRTPEGHYVFLEVNPQGEWGMLQRDLGYPIAETIADNLVNKINHAAKNTHHHALER